MTTDLGDPDGADRVRHRGPLAAQNVYLAQLGHDLFGGVSLLTHSDPPSALTSHTSGWTTPTGADQAALPGSEVKGTWASMCSGEGQWSLTPSQRRRRGDRGWMRRQASRTSMTPRDRRAVARYAGLIGAPTRAGPSAVRKGSPRPAMRTCAVA